jgi:lipopolysaccharide/colanic/teichoic acid biosynthesis glycosyltransferase
MAVRLRMGKGVIYRQPRVGLGGSTFTMYKFRSMTPDRRKAQVPFDGVDRRTCHKRDDDPRHTSLGRFIRKSRLDELPQLVNVLQGDMSLVGPRPIRPAFFAELCVGIPQYWQRLVVRPGITGLAQLRLTREMTWGEKLAHDLEYIADRSVSLYLTVIFTTIWLIIVRPANGRAKLNKLP